MKQEKISKAYSALIKLSNYQLPLKKAYEVYKLVKSVEDPYNFACSEEKKYISELHGNVQPDGSISFENVKDYELFVERHNELNEMEVDVDITPVHLSERDMGAQLITPAEIHSLEDFVSFE